MNFNNHAILSHQYYMQINNSYHNQHIIGHVDCGTTTEILFCFTKQGQASKVVQQ